MTAQPSASTPTRTLVQRHIARLDLNFSSRTRTLSIRARHDKLNYYYHHVSSRPNAKDRNHDKEKLTGSMRENEEIGGREIGVDRAKMA